jgi:hypothetical protein
MFKRVPSYPNPLMKKEELKALSLEELEKRENQAGP